MVKDFRNPTPRSIVMEATPCDIWVGTRVRTRRAHMSMSAQKLADAISVTRITCGKLFEISQALDIHPGWFFDDFKRGKTMGGYAEELNGLATAENINLLTAFAHLLPDQRKALLMVVASFRAVNIAETTASNAASQE